MAKQTSKATGLQSSRPRALPQGWGTRDGAWWDWHTHSPQMARAHSLSCPSLAQTSLHMVVTVVGGVHLEGDSGKTKHGAQKSCVGPQGLGVEARASSHLGPDSGPTSFPQVRRGKASALCCVALSWWKSELGMVAKQNQGPAVLLGPSSSI